MTGRAEDNTGGQLATAAVLPGRFNYIGAQPFGIFPTPQHLALVALGDMQGRSHVLDAAATARGA